ncbi:MAG: hypothetical protein HRO68_04075 [Nitrosopumilus sp.]|nr:hypothetical protein [Nitrosopumilus sp.]
MMENYAVPFTEEFVQSTGGRLGFEDDENDLIYYSRLGRSSSDGVT